MKLSVELLPAQRIAYYRSTGPYGESNKAVMDKLKAWATEHNLLKESSIIYGIPQDHPEYTPPEKCRYDTCIVISKNFQIDSSIQVGLLSSGKYAVCQIEHTKEALEQAWAELFPAIQNAGYTVINNKPIMERYTGEQLANGNCELCVPII